MPSIFLLSFLITLPASARAPFRLHPLKNTQPDAVVTGCYLRPKGEKDSKKLFVRTHWHDAVPSTIRVNLGGEDLIAEGMGVHRISPNERREFRSKEFSAELVFQVSELTEENDRFPVHPKLRITRGGESIAVSLEGVCEE